MLATSCSWLIYSNKLKINKKQHYLMILCGIQFDIDVRYTTSLNHTSLKHITHCYNSL